MGWPEIPFGTVIIAGVGVAVGLGVGFGVLRGVLLADGTGVAFTGSTRGAFVGSRMPEDSFSSSLHPNIPIRHTSVTTVIFFIGCE